MFQDKGQVAVMRPLNDTHHYSVYLTIPFDGSSKSIHSTNYHGTPINK